MRSVRMWKRPVSYTHLDVYKRQGLDSGHRRPRFVRDFLAQGGSIAGAVRAYADAVQDGSFPTADHSYAA